MEQPHAKVGVGVMIMKGDRVLMALRTTSHGAGTHQFPGGHLEYMETFEDCAKREVREECGIEIQNVEFTYTANMLAFAPKHFVHIGLRADWKSGEPQQLEPDKSGPWGWYTLDQLPQPLNVYAVLQIKAITEGRHCFDDVSTL